MGKLQALAPVVFLGPTTPADWRTLGEQFADAANVSDSYGAFIEQYDERAQEISKKYQDKLGGLKFAGVCSSASPIRASSSDEYKSSYVTNCSTTWVCSSPASRTIGGRPRRVRRLRADLRQAR